MKTTKTQRTVEIDKLEMMDLLLASMYDGRPTIKVVATIVEPTRLYVVDPVELFGKGEV